MINIISIAEPKYAVNIQDKIGRYKLEVSAPGFKKGDFLEDHISAKYHSGLFTVNLKKSEKGVLLKKRQIKIH